MERAIRIREYELEDVKEMVESLLTVIDFISISPTPFGKGPRLYFISL